MFVDCFSDVETDDLHTVRDIYVVESILAPMLSAFVDEWRSFDKEELARALTTVFEEGLAHISGPPACRSFCFDYINSQVDSIHRCLQGCTDPNDLQSVKPFMLNGKKFLRILDEHPGLKAILPDRWAASRQAQLSREALLSSATVRQTFGEVFELRYDGLVAKPRIGKDKLSARFGFQVSGSKCNGKVAVHWESDLESREFKVVSVEIIRTP
jgi:hypothetical protein